MAAALGEAHAELAGVCFGQGCGYRCQLEKLRLSRCVAALHRRKPTVSTGSIAEEPDFRERSLAPNADGGQAFIAQAGCVGLLPSKADTRGSRE